MKMLFLEVYRKIYKIEIDENIPYYLLKKRSVDKDEFKKSVSWNEYHGQRFDLF